MSIIQGTETIEASAGSEAIRAITAEHNLISESLVSGRYTREAVGRVAVSLTVTPVTRTRHRGHTQSPHGEMLCGAKEVRY